MGDRRSGELGDKGIASLNKRGSNSENVLDANSGRMGSMANVLCVLYDDPVDGYPPAYGA